MDTNAHLVSTLLYGIICWPDEILTNESRLNRVEKGHCVIGVERKFLIVPVAFDIGISV